MIRIAFVGFLVLLAIMVETAAPAFAAWSPSPSPSTTSFGLGLAADRMAAERNETITYTIWRNATVGAATS